MAYDFARVIERRHTESSKWRKYGEDVVPLWVADMDFASPEPVIRALRERVEKGVFGFGYNQERTPLHAHFADRLQKISGWRRRTTDGGGDPLGVSAVTGDHR